MGPWVLGEGVSKTGQAVVLAPKRGCDGPSPTSASASGPPQADPGAICTHLPVGCGEACELPDGVAPLPRACAVTDVGSLTQQCRQMDSS